MKNTHIIYTAVLALLGVGGLSSCNDFLDELPDNRTTVDTEDKVKQILVSAYPDNDYNLMCEYMSDNVDEFDNTYTIAFLDEIYKWEDATETNNESPERYWSAAYEAATTANMALEGIEEVGGATNQTLRECKGEALIARAYAHFMLVNIFSLNYNSATADKDLGIPYMYDTGSEIGTVKDRGTVADVYAKIEKDIEEGLPLVGDTHLDVPKYHFNRLAAYAFATRFYLYYEKWDKAIECANQVLGSNPKAMLRDWVEHTTNIASQIQPRAQHYVSSELTCNLLLATAYSYGGIAFGNYSTWKKYAHGPYLDASETAQAQNIWGGVNMLREPIKTYQANATWDIFWRVPNLFEYTDAVAGIGYRRTIWPLFTTDECLLNRAEAYIMTKQYEKAAADLTLWMQNFTTSTVTLTPEYIRSFYNSTEYCYSDNDKMEGTIKKHLNPAFTIDVEGSTQETMLQCVLGFRRLESMPNGLRWFDVKRYGIEFPRRIMSASGAPAKKTDFLSKDDPRRAVQIPLKVRQAGVTPNPR